MQIVSSSLQMVGISREEVQTRRSLRMVVDNPLKREESSGKNFKNLDFISLAEALLKVIDKILSGLTL